MAGREKLEGQIFGDFKIIRYIGDKKYKCVCLNCNDEVKELYAVNIKQLHGVTCKLKKDIVIDLTDQIIGEWHVLEYVGKKRYRCRCSCGNEKDVLKVNLLNGTSKSCGHNHRHHGDLTGKQFGEWKVLCKDGYNWRVQCSCGEIHVRGTTDLVDGKSKSCGHGYNKFYDISGNTYGLWKVLKYVGSQKYLCECQCENKTQREVRKADLINGASTSCGCNKGAKIKNTLLMRYGEVGPNKVSNARSSEQLIALESRENLLYFILKKQEELGCKLTSTMLSERLGIGLHRTLVYIKQYNLNDYVIINSGTSTGEIELINYIKSLYNGTIITKDRYILHGKELDIYIPEKKLAIEFNGVYWHSSLLKDYKFHQQKTIDCAKQGIQLIHIFEYEWVNAHIRIKLENMLKTILIDESQCTLYARELHVEEISVVEANKFMNDNHLQGSINCAINLGLIRDNKIYGVMTFGKPRFDSSYDYELYRLCFFKNIKITGGAAKLFSYFINKYNPASVVTYCDISKFTGNVYSRLGFKVLRITEPNYKWVKANTFDILTRYQTQKHKLIEQGIGTEDQTEDEIMYNLDYLKIYDSGNLKLEWIKDKEVTT